MKEEFKSLISEDYNKKYIKYLKNDAFTGVLQKAFKAESLIECEEIIQNELISYLNKDQLKALANPFYVGFGNPNSDILIIGKEKAFYPNNTKLLIKESINNYSQWSKILSNTLTEKNQNEICETLGFNPQLPKSYHKGNFKRTHTWSIISIIIKNIYKDEILSLTETSSLEKSIFNKCFLTELNFIPAKYHEGSGLSDERKQFLNNNFYKSFPIVIFSAKSYIKGKYNIIKELFNSAYIDTFSLDTIGDKRKREIKIEMFQSNSQTIFISNQLSGASGWSNKALDAFASHISAYLPANKTNFTHPHSKRINNERTI